jgi:tripartite-type tricarboxylate transporter receptor subunit TctC
VGEFLSGYDASAWFGIAAPKQTPVQIIELLNREINAGLDDPTLKARIAEFGGIPLAGTFADFEKLFVRDAEKWAKVMKAANIKAE